VFFVVFERLIGTAANYLSAWTKWKTKWSVLAVVVLGLAGVIGGVWFGVSTFVHRFDQIRHGAHEIRETIRQSHLYHQYGHFLGRVTIERVLEGAREHAEGAMHAAIAVGRGAIYVVIGLIFSVVFLLERDELEAWREKMPLDSPPRILLRYIGYVADAIAITLKLQVIVAVVNTLITLPVLIALRLPGIPALMALLFITGLIPVVGGPVAGGVLMTVAYVTRGAGGLGVFLASTFVLHKIESYYLSPRLTAKHVKLPGFVLITSLVLFEHAFGLAGLFLSFPCLYVAAKIREGWIDPADDLREEEETSRFMRGALPRFQGFKRPKALSNIRRGPQEATGAGPASTPPVAMPAALPAATEEAAAEHTDRAPSE